MITLPSPIGFYCIAGFIFIDDKLVQCDPKTIDAMDEIPAFLGPWVPSSLRRQTNANPKSIFRQPEICKIVHAQYYEKGHLCEQLTPLLECSTQGVIRNPVTIIETTLGSRTYLCSFLHSAQNKT